MLNEKTEILKESMQPKSVLFTEEIRSLFITLIFFFP